MYLNLLLYPSFTNQQPNFKQVNRQLGLISIIYNFYLIVLINPISGILQYFQQHSINFRSVRTTSRIHNISMNPRKGPGFKFGLKGPHYASYSWWHPFHLGVGRLLSVSVCMLCLVIGQLQTSADPGLNTALLMSTVTCWSGSASSWQSEMRVLASLFRRGMKLVN